MIRIGSLFLTQHKYSSILIRIWTIAIILFTGYRGYQLGWTTKYIPEEIIEFSAWTDRLWYANQGFQSLLHLNIFSIILASAIIVVPVIFYVFLFRPQLITDNPIIILISYCVLLVISIYTFVRFDTPNNYYASRYFIPVLLPMVILLFSYLLKKLRSRVLTIIAILSVISFNFYYIFFMFQNPERTGRVELVEEIADFVPRGSLIFLISDTFSHYLLTPVLTEYHAAKVIHLDYDNNMEEKDYVESIIRYSDELGFDSAYVISEYSPSYVLEYKSIDFVNRLYPNTILYPDEVIETSYQYYLFKSYQPISKIEIDNPDNYRFFIEGFSQVEKNQVETWIWSNGASSKLEVPLKPKMEYLLTFQASPFAVTEEFQNVEVILNGKSLGRIEMSTNEAQEYSIVLPSEFTKAINQIEFKYSYVKTPKEVYGANDERLLAVRFLNFEFEEIQ